MGQLPAGDWMTAAEVADLLGVGKRRVLYLISEGRIPHREIAGAFVVRRADAAKFKAAHSSKPGPKPGSRRKKDG